MRDSLPALWQIKTGWELKLFESNEKEDNYITWILFWFWMKNIGPLLPVQLDVRLFLSSRFNEEFIRLKTLEIDRLKLEKDVWQADFYKTKWRCEHNTRIFAMFHTADDGTPNAQ